MTESPLTFSDLAEESLLGSMLNYETSIEDAIKVLGGSRPLYHLSHRLIYEAIIFLYNKSIPVDIVSVSNLLEKQGWLDDRCGGRVGLIELATNHSVSSTSEYHAKIILEKSRIRDLLDICGTMHQQCIRQEKTIEEIVGETEEKLFNLTTHNQEVKVVTYEDIYPELIEEHDYRRSLGGQIPGLESKYIDLDKMIGGFRKKKLYIMGGRPSMGKSSLAVNILDNICVDVDSAAYFSSVEMDAKEVGARSMYGNQNMSVKDGQEGRLSDDEEARIYENSLRFTKKKIIIDEIAPLNINMLRGRLRRAFRKWPIKIVCIDYLQLMEGPGESRNLEISYISRNLRAMAKEFNVPFLVLSQLSRAVESRNNKRPILSDLRDSGSIEQDADVVLFLYNHDYYLEKMGLPLDDKARVKARDGGVEIICSKQRSGPTGVVKLRWFPERCRFENKSF